MSESQTDKSADDLIEEEVLAAAERWQEYDESILDGEQGPLGEIDPLDILVQANIDGTVREVTLVVTTGGPHIEVNVTSQEIVGWWGGASHKSSYFNEKVSARIEDYVTTVWRETVLA